jgi:hypothetical protein
MKTKKLIAEALLEIAKNSETTFIEVADNKELIKTAEKLGIVIPSPDLSIFKTVYAEIDKVNRNGVVLPKKAVEDGLPTLIGKQINWEHEGAGRICGYIIDAKINGDKIEIIGVIFKSLFPEEMVGVEEKFAKKALTVSFEVWNRNPKNGESVIHELENGFYALDPIVFHGCGLLLENNPACPKAIVYKLVASTEIINAEKIVEKIFEENLICASMAIEEPMCKNCTTCTCEKEVKIVEEIKAEEIQITPEPAQVTEPAPIVDQKPAEQAQVEEPCVEVPKLIKIITEETVSTTEIPNETGNSVERKGNRKCTRVYSDNKEEVSTEEFTVVDTYSYAQLEEKVNASIEELVAALPKEVSDRVKELVKDGKPMKEAMKQAWEEYKKSQEKALEDKDTESATLKIENEKILGEKDKELEKTKQELGIKDQEIAELKIIKAKAETTKEKPSLTVGSVDSADVDLYKTIRDKVDERAFGHKSS